MPKKWYFSTPSQIEAKIFLRPSLEHTLEKKHFPKLLWIFSTWSSELRQAVTIFLLLTTLLMSIYFNMLGSFIKDWITCHIYSDLSFIKNWSTFSWAFQVRNQAPAEDSWSTVQKYEPWPCNLLQHQTLPLYFASYSSM